MVFYDEATASAARNVCVIAISVVRSAGTDIQPYVTENNFEKEHLDSEIPDSEFSGYQLLCRKSSSRSGNEFTLENFRTKAKSIKDFWDGYGQNLPVLSKIGRTYGF